MEELETDQHISVDGNVNLTTPVSRPPYHHDGVVTIGQRFDGIEKTLRSIDHKLDTKADKADIERLERLKADRAEVERNENRLRIIESGDSPAGKMFFERFGRVESDLSEIVRHGSAQAQDAAKELAITRQDMVAMQSQIVALREENVRFNSLQDAKVSESLQRSRLWTMAISLINVVILVGNLVVVVVLHH